MSERSETLADGSFSGRRPTSHERRTGLPWDASYQYGPAPWDIGCPQPAIVRLATEGGFAGAVLDAGCGTGENSLHVASLGFPVLGVDVAETALAIAREKAGDRGLPVEFVSADALQLGRLGRRFRTVLDCGLFHTFDGDERSDYVASLASVIEHEGTLYILCFSDQGPDTGPHPISQAELRAAFTPGNGWSVAAIRPERIHTSFHENGAPAWFASDQTDPGRVSVFLSAGADSRNNEQESKDAKSPRARLRGTAEGKGRAVGLQKYEGKDSVTATSAATAALGAGT